MKKLTLAALAACLLLLSACQQPPAESEAPTPDPTPTQTQTAETPPVSPAPETSADPGHEAPVFPEFLENFTFTQGDARITENGNGGRITYQFTGEELEQLKEALAMDSWYATDEYPDRGYTAHYTLYDREGHSLVVAKWDEERCFIVVQEDSASWTSPSYHYCAPAAVLDAMEPYLAKFRFLPDYDPYFDFDQIEVDRTPYEDREGYQDHDVYLLDSAQKLSLLDLLGPDTWVEAAGEELTELDAVYFEAFRFRDDWENLVTLSPWDEEKCLVNFFFVYLRDRNLRIDKVVRFWAPASVLENTLTFVDSLTPLGTIDNEAARYFNLFKQDWGFDMLIRDATESGNISDDQMAAYVFYVQSQEGRVYFDTGVSPSAVDEITQKYFGKKMSSYDTAWSKVLPSGNVTATGWDTTSGEYPVLTGTPHIDEYGNITATFRIYSLPEHLWLEEKLPWSVLGHVREYLLTGHGDVLLEADEWSHVYDNEITFRIETEEVNGVQKEYVVYLSSRMVD